MARRSIYSRRQSMPVGTYETPLADFLDALPQYINQYQQNQLALQRQQLMDKRYEDSVKRQELQDRRAEERQQINTIMNFSRDFDNPIDKKKYLVKMVEDNPSLSKYFPANYLSNTLNEEIKFDNSVDDVIDRFTEFKALPDTQKLTNYNQLEDIMSGLQELRPKVRGTKYENKVSNNYTELLNLDANLKRISGSRFSDEQMSDYLKNELEGVRTTANNLEKEFRKAEADLNKISTFNPATQQYEKLKAENELQKQLEEIGASNWETVSRTYNLARQRFNEAEESKVNFYENNNLIYPQIVTAESINEAKKRDEMALSLSSQVQSDREKEINKYISDNEPLLLNILNKGEASDELIDSIERFTGIQEGGTDYDEFKNLKDLVAQERNVEEILSSAPEVAEQNRIMGVLKEGEDELPTTVATTPEIVTPETPVKTEDITSLEQTLPSIQTLPDEEVVDDQQDLTQDVADRDTQAGNIVTGLLDALNINQLSAQPTTPTTETQIDLFSTEPEKEISSKMEAQIKTQEERFKKEDKNFESNLNASKDIFDSNIRDSAGNRINITNSKQFNDQISSMANRIKQINKESGVYVPGSPKTYVARKQLLNEQRQLYRDLFELKGRLQGINMIYYPDRDSEGLKTGKLVKKDIKQYMQSLNRVIKSLPPEYNLKFKTDPVSQSKYESILRQSA